MSSLSQNDTKSKKQKQKKIKNAENEVGLKRRPIDQLYSPFLYTVSKCSNKESQSSFLSIFELLVGKEEKSEDKKNRRKRRAALHDSEVWRLVRSHLAIGFNECSKLMRKNYPAADSVSVLLVDSSLQESVFFQLLVSGCASKNYPVILCDALSYFLSKFLGGRQHSCMAIKAHLSEEENSKTSDKELISKVESVMRDAANTFLRFTIPIFKSENDVVDNDESFGKVEEDDDDGNIGSGFVSNSGTGTSLTGTTHSKKRKHAPQIAPHNKFKSESTEKDHNKEKKQIPQTTHKLPQPKFNSGLTKSDCTRKTQNIPQDVGDSSGSPSLKIEGKKGGDTKQREVTCNVEIAGHPSFQSGKDQPLFKKPLIMRMKPRPQPGGGNLSGGDLT